MDTPAEPLNPTALAASMTVRSLPGSLAWYRGVVGFTVDREHEREAVLLTLPRGEAVRQHLLHLSHHRGRLTVYVRLLDVAVPSVYGSTADEPW